VRKQAVVVQTGLHPHDNPLDWFAVTCKDVDYPRLLGLPDPLLAAGDPDDRLRPLARLEGGDQAHPARQRGGGGVRCLLDPAGPQRKILIDLA